uniref:Zn(2)-C6 fungal-type domain-containing protein n=1 Tax=Ganoderma boninense TaxID=34458 RepID=A0A5K1K2J5_9APHY|nr:Zn(2)-C6 fungal-type domain-containing protein [Ganoderma boninense]
MSPPDALLNEDAGRLVLFPIRHPKIAQHSFWTPEEIDFSDDLADWTTVLTGDERHLLSVILAFFASADGIVGENLVQQFYSDIGAPEARCFYGFQLMMENIHAETYARLIQELVQDEDELHRLFGAVNTSSVVRGKALWCLKWFDRAAYSFPVRLVAFAIVEGVFFSSSFAAIFWVRTRGILPGLCHSNEMIMRDEGQHVEFACEVYSMLTEKASSDVIHGMVREAVVLEQAFFDTALPNPLRGLNAVLMKQYIEYVADFLLRCLGFPVLYGSDNPFPFMDGSTIPGRANFFERPVSDYQGAPTGFTSRDGVV